MAEALTARDFVGSTSDMVVTWPDRFTRVRPMFQRSPDADLKLEQALRAFDRTKSYEENQAAQQRILALSRDAVPSVLDRLAEPQPPDRQDVLMSLLVRWQSPDEVIELASAEAAGPILRAALAEALALYAGGPYEHDERVMQRVATTLARLARDSDAGVRVASVEAIGLAGLYTAPGVRDLLREVASDDASESVRAEAKSVLEETE